MQTYFSRSIRILFLFLFLFLFFCSVTVHAQNKVENKTIYNIVKHTNAALQYYGINDITIYVQPINHHIQYQKNDPSQYLKGTVHKAHPKMYTVFLNENLNFQKFIETLYHEITHVKQLYFEELDLSISSQFYRFKDDTIRKNFKLSHQAFEIEARKYADVMVDSLGIYRHRQREKNVRY